MTRRLIVAALAGLALLAESVLWAGAVAHAQTPPPLSLTLYESATGTVYVKLHGATGNGATDDRAAIQASIGRAASAGGGVVYFGAGTYLIGATLTVDTSRVTLLGSRGSSTITTGAGTFAHVDIVGTSGQYVQHVTVRGLRFIGAGLGIKTHFTETLLVSECFFSGTQNGLYMAMVGGEQDIKPTVTFNRADNVGRFIQSGDTRVADGVFSFNYVIDATVRAFDFGYLDGATIIGNKVFNDLASSTENDGIQVLRPIYMTLQGNDVFSVNGYGIRISSPRRSHIVGNTVIGTGVTNKKSAFVLPYYSGVASELNEVRDNKVYGSYGSGFDFTQLTNSDVSGNKVIGAGQGGATFDALLLSSCSGLRVRDLFIDGQGVTRYWLNTTTSTSIALGPGITVTGTVQSDVYRNGANGLQIAWNPGAPLSVTATVTATFLDSVILANATTGALTVNLPTATACAGKEFEVIKTDSSANAVTVDPASTETVDGATTKVLASQYSKVRIVSNGTNWLSE